MRCAVVNTITGEVVNIIMAEADAVPPPGCALVPMDDDCPAMIGWLYGESEGFHMAPPPEGGSNE